MTKLQISEILYNIYLFQAAVSALFGSLSFVVLNFVTYQITFLLTCQPHKLHKYENVCLHFARQDGQDCTKPERKSRN